MNVAFLYDFDKTLTPRDMQEYGFIEALGITEAKEFWAIVSQTAEDEKMDRILSYLYVMVQQAKRNGLKLTQELLASYGRQVTYFPGVETWFSTVNEIGHAMGIDVQHYVVSSGLKEIIDATTIAKEFKRIFACEYLYDDQGEAVWPKLTINYTNKMQFIFRVNKGILDINNDVDLNTYMAESDRPVPLTNMVYFGDGLTDVPSMKLVKTSGGHSIAVYTPASRHAAEMLAQHGRVDFIAPADYSDGGQLMEITRRILKHLAASDELRNVTWKGEPHND
ncbi:MAG: haloacid dehalogenase-like hydrolase [Erysipelotrichales bacterium]|nr:MAG: haloacid dehalogenase-like hydrolase [Erysipelotrichales bacterium]